MVWLAHGTQGRTDLGLCWAPRPVTTLEVYKALGIIVGFWQKAMEPKSLMIDFLKNPHWGVTQHQPRPLVRCRLLVIHGSASSLPGQGEALGHQVPRGVLPPL